MATPPDPDRGPAVVALCITMIILPTIAIALRIWSRLTLKSQRFWWDDWFAIASLPFMLATLSIVLQWVSEGFGHHAIQLAPEKLARGPKYLYAFTFAFDLAITLPKYSAMLFYVRVFRLNSISFRVNVFAGLGLVTAWLLFAILSTIFQCTPIQKAWLPLTAGHCINNYQWFLGSATTNVIIDVYITLMPVPVIWKLHTGRPRKLVLTGFFFCAYCVLVVSLGRLVAIVQAGETFEADLTWNGITYLHWVIAEGAISIVSICLPNITYLVQRGRQHGVKALFTRREYALSPGRHPKKGRELGLVHGNKGFHRMGGTGTLSSVDDQLIAGQGGMYSVGATAPQPSREREIALGQVHMRHDIDVTEDERWAPV